jgi:sugar lactone lactonase YvrE
LTQWNPANTNSLVYPSDLVFDAFGNLIVADASAAKVFSFNPALAGQTVNTGAITLGYPTQAKVDFGGNLYITDGGNTPRIVVIPGEIYDTAYTPSVLNLGSSSVSFPQSLGVDNSGANLYVGDGDTNQILKIGLAGTGVSQVAIAPCDATVTSCAFNQAAGFAFDPNGDMYVADAGLRVLMVPANHSASSPTTQLPLTGLVNPSAVTLDGSGNIYITDLSGTVNKLLVNAGAMKISTLNATQTTTVTNTGNLSLAISSLTFASGAGSAFSETDTCTSATIGPGGSCTITVKYSNAAGTAPDTLKITSNAFSASGVSIQVTH